MNTNKSKNESIHDIFECVKRMSPAEIIILAVIIIGFVALAIYVFVDILSRDRAPKDGTKIIGESSFPSTSFVKDTNYIFQNITTGLWLTVGGNNNRLILTRNLVQALPFTYSSSDSTFTSSNLPVSKNSNTQNLFLSPIYDKVTISYQVISNEYSSIFLVSRVISENPEIRLLSVDSSLTVIAIEGFQDAGWFAFPASRIPSVPKGNSTLPQDSIVSPINGTSYNIVRFDESSLTISNDISPEGYKEIDLGSGSRFTYNSFDGFSDSTDSSFILSLYEVYTSPFISKVVCAQNTLEGISYPASVLSVPYTGSSSVIIYFIDQVGNKKYISVGSSNEIVPLTFISTLENFFQCLWYIKL